MRYNLPMSVKTEARKSAVLDRLFPYLLLGITLAALVRVLMLGSIAPINIDGYKNLYTAFRISLVPRTWEGFDGFQGSLGPWRGQTHPILFFLALRAAMLLGHFQLLYRSVSFIPGLAGVYLTGLIMARICRNKSVALLAAAAYGLSQTMQRIFIDLRSYSLGLFFIIAAFHSLVAAVDDGRGRRPLAWFGVLAALAVASEYYALLFIVAGLGSLALLWAVRPAFRQRARDWRRQGWAVPLTALGPSVLVFAGLYQTHLKGYIANHNEFECISNLFWDSKTPLLGFILRGLQADLNYLLPFEISPTAAAAIVLAVLAMVILQLLPKAPTREGRSPAASLPGLMSFFLLAGLVFMAMLRLFPFGGYERQQSILLPFFIMTAFAILDRLISLLPDSGRASWWRTAVLAITVAGMGINYHWVDPRYGLMNDDVTPRRPYLGHRPDAAPPPRSAPGQAGIRWVRIPGGSFMMGSNLDADSRPRHQVRVPSFEMAQALVTNRQYRDCVSAGVCAPAHDSGPWFAADDQPVVGVDWEQARTFSQWVGGRLPTEAEWEYAARGGGRDQRFPWGDKEATCENLVFDDCGGTTAPVCSRPAGDTRHGLCDMAGNVWEWLQDRYHGTYEGAPADGSAWETGPLNEKWDRVLRGGSWTQMPNEISPTIRGYRHHRQQSLEIGFRPVR